MTVSVAITTRIDSSRHLPEFLQACIGSYNLLEAPPYKFGIECIDFSTFGHLLPQGGGPRNWNDRCEDAIGPETAASREATDTGHRSSEGWGWKLKI